MKKNEHQFSEREMSNENYLLACVKICRGEYSLSAVIDSTKPREIGIALAKDEFLQIELTHKRLRQALKEKFSADFRRKPFFYQVLYSAIFKTFKFSCQEINLFLENLIERIMSLTDSQVQQFENARRFYRVNDCCREYLSLNS